MACWLAALTTVLAAGVIRADEPPPESESDVLVGFDQWSAAVVSLNATRWVGERVEVPVRWERPITIERHDSSRLPLSVHVAEGADSTAAPRILAALERAHVHLRDTGWPLPRTDGGLGATPGFDLYVVPGAPAAEARYDGQARWRYLDEAEVHAVVAADLPASDLEACVADAYARAALLALDPAESVGWRAVTADYLVRPLVGPAGCHAAVEQSQAQPWLGLVAHPEQDPARGGALLLEELAARHDTSPGQFVRDLWELNQQRTWEGRGLRGAPDGWLSLDALVRGAGDDVAERVHELAIERFLPLTAPVRERSPGLRVAEPLFALAWTDLPKGFHSTARPPHEVILQPMGSVAAHVDVTAAPANARLRVWLRGEFGVRWTLSAAVLDAEGSERTRLTAVERRGTPEAYLPVELPTGAATVVVVATNLGPEPTEDAPHPAPNTDAPASHGRAMRLSFDGRRADQD